MCFKFLFIPYVKSRSSYFVLLPVKTKNPVIQTLDIPSYKTSVFSSLRNKLRTSLPRNIIVLRNAASCNLVWCADVSGHSAVCNFKVYGLKITWNHAAEFGSLTEYCF